MFILNEKQLSLDTPFTTPDGTQYPANWLRLATSEEKQAIGIIEAPDSPVWDERYFWGYDNEGNLIPKQLEDEIITPEEGEPYTKTGLKTQHINQNKQTANKLLAPTDWYVIRKLERNIDIPVDVVSYRSDVIEVATQRETLIKSVTTVEELKGLYETTYVGIGISATIQSHAMPEWPNINI